MDKTYEPQKHEDAIYKKWEESGAFQPSKSQRTFTIPIPPPNVTGTLHAGHSMFITLQDILIRWHRMMGEASLWIPGTDHAAIATESVVLKNLGIEDRNKEISREDFIKEAEEWTKKTHARITDQIKKMGASCDWAREAYTFDGPRNLAVNTIFKMLYDKGLIYRGNRMINWSIGAQSVLADDEVEWGEKTEPFYYIRCGEFIIGTVRPETKCSHSPVVVSETGKYVRVKFSVDGRPDEFFILSENLFGDAEQRKKVLNLLDPLGTFEVIETFTGKELEGREFEYDTYAGKRRFVVLADEEVIDMEKGAGAMTISCCHSADDYDLAKRRGLEDYWFQKIDFEGNMTSIAGPCAGMNVNIARKHAAKIMKEKGLLVGEDKSYAHRVPICYRSHTVVEPMVSKQWFIAVEKEFTDDFSGEKTTLKKQMQEAVRVTEHTDPNDFVKIIPSRFEKTYFHWIDNLRDWCISRQIWWGHRIPVWYDENDEVVAVGVVNDPDPKWRQDEDTLDTWFSSATWPFSIFGWPSPPPEKGESEGVSDFNRFYPTSVLETGHDILFFWVARMIMFGKFATGKYPFKTVYLHGLVCDEKGQKMSKSKGNGIDPLEIIKEFGTDALRLSLIMGTTPGNNSNMGKEKIAGCRNFCNKLWNISRFVLTQNELQMTNDKLQISESSDLQKWLLFEVSSLIRDVDFNLQQYQFGSAAEKLWNFTWNEFADWALEAAKAENSSQTNALLQKTLEILLRLWHPFIPFVTEKIWEEMNTEKILIASEWPKYFSSEDAFWNAAVDWKPFDQVKEIISKIRSMRKLAGVDPTKKITALIQGENCETLERNAEIIKSLARLETLEFGTIPEEKGATDTAAGFTIFLPSSGMIDPVAEKVRVKKELEKAEKMLAGFQAKLGNEGYLKQAPKELVEQTRQQAKELEEKIAVLKKQA